MSDTNDDEKPFDISLLYSRLGQLVASRGSARRIDVSATRAHVVLVPDESTLGSCVVVSVTDDVAVITAGVGARLKIAADSEDAEEELVAVVTGILDGGAREYAAADETGALRLHLMVKYARGSYGFPVTDEVFLRHLPAWSPAKA